MSDPIKSTSKFLSYVLRHHPESIGIELDSEGWVDVSILLTQAAAHQRDISPSCCTMWWQTTTKNALPCRPMARAFGRRRGILPHK